MTLEERHIRIKTGASFCARLAPKSSRAAHQTYFLNISPLVQAIRNVSSPQIISKGIGTNFELHTVTAGMAETAEIEIKASQWRQVEVGRVVLFTHGQYTGRLAAIVEIIDHKRVCLGSYPFTHSLWPDFENRYWWMDHLRKKTQLSLVNPSH